MINCFFCIWQMLELIFPQTTRAKRHLLICQCLNKLAMLCGGEARRDKRHATARTGLWSSRPCCRLSSEMLPIYLITLCCISEQEKTVNYMFRGRWSGTGTWMRSNKLDVVKVWAESQAVPRSGVTETECEPYLNFIWRLCRVGLLLVFLHSQPMIKTDV